MKISDEKDGCYVLKTNRSKRECYLLKTVYEKGECYLLTMADAKVGAAEDQMKR